MIKSRNYWCGILLAFSLLGSQSLHSQEVIVNHQVQIQQLRRNEVRAIFAMRRRTWPDGTPFQVFVLPDNHPLHHSFCKKVLGIFPHQLRRIWDRSVFSGTGQAPVEVDSMEEMHDQVAKTEGAIGYLERQTLDDSVKLIEVR